MNTKNDISIENDDTRIGKIEQVLPPIALLEKYPASSVAVKTVENARHEAHNIIHGEDDRLLVVIGPCSIHDPKAALEYAKRIKLMREKYQDTLQIIMRVYFEKPRTTVGWKGLINDPHLNNTYALNDGLRMARKLLSDINDLTVPTAGEFLDMITPQYLADFMSWGAIGARTTESQVHRELASGLSCAVGFKNATNGGVKIALDAIGAAEAPHHFLSVTKFGHSAIVSTKGNEDCHIILRGGDKGPNYRADDVAAVVGCQTGTGPLREGSVRIQDAGGSVVRGDRHRPVIGLGDGQGRGAEFLPGPPQGAPVGQVLQHGIAQTEQVRTAHRITSATQSASSYGVMTPTRAPRAANRRPSSSSKEAVPFVVSAPRISTLLPPWTIRVTHWTRSCTEPPSYRSVMSTTMALRGSVMSDSA